MSNAVLDEHHVRELEEIGIADVKDELKNDCLPEHLLEAARIWLKLKAPAAAIMPSELRLT